ncbi:hypothetical protein D3C85_1220030 [compost metagenome]
MNLALDQDNKAEIDLQRKALQLADEKGKGIRKEVTNLMTKNDKAADINDNNYIFLSFVTQYLPEGLIGLLLWVQRPVR